MTFISYAQNYEDVMLWRALKHIESGFYVDVGANDPVADSVTKAFYDNGWRGLNIEPISGWYEKLRSQRPRDINLQVAVGDYNGELELFEVVDTGLSTTNSDYAERHAEEHGFTVRQTQVPVLTLSSILENHQITDIHFLKIDVEGSEQAVLKGLDLSSVRPWIIVIEATKPMTSAVDFERWESLIIQKNYLFSYFDGINRFYIAKEHAELAEAFTSPPNFWDNYKRRSEYEANKTVEKLSVELETQKASRYSLEQSVKTLETSLNELRNSRSMKLTAPLRQSLDIVRKIKKSPKTIPRKIVKIVVEQPRLRRAVKPIVNKFPGLQYRLSYFLHNGNSVNNKYHTIQLENSDLSTRATRILRDIQETLQQ